jgi:hypothetical protein
MYVKLHVCTHVHVKLHVYVVPFTVMVTGTAVPGFFLVKNDTY